MSVKIPLTSTLRRIDRGETIQIILQAALQAVDPAEAVNRHMQIKDNKLTISGFSYDLDKIQRIRLVGAGKAGFPMTLAASKILGKRLNEGIVIVKEGYMGDPAQSPEIMFVEAGHPIPDERGVSGTRRIKQFLSDSRPDDLVIALISGGGSALLTLPVPGVSLEDLQTLTAELLASGADIQEINTLRKHLDQVKGGGLASWCAPARLAALILSDVVGNPIDVIASGPTVPDPSSFADAKQILTKYHLQKRTPQSIRKRIQDGEQGNLPDTPKSGDPLFKGVQNVIVGSNLQAAEAALAAASKAGLNSQVLTTYLQGEAVQVGKILAGFLQQEVAANQPLPRPACLILGGETTVTIDSPDTAGKGGRNQELALGAVSSIAGLDNVFLITLATDGGDGPTDAAGAVVSGETYHRAIASGLDPIDYLQRHDAYNFFASLDDLLKIGPTQTNVNDLTFLFAL